MINSSLGYIKLTELKIMLFLRLAKENYFDKALIGLSETSGSISTALVTTVIGAPIGIESASLESITTGIIKNLLKTIQNKNEKHIELIMLVMSK